MYPKVEKISAKQQSAQINNHHKLITKEKLNYYLDIAFNEII